MLYRILSPFDKRKIVNTEITKNTSPNDSLSMSYKTVPNDFLSPVFFKKYINTNAITPRINTESAEVKIYGKESIASPILV